MSEEDRIELKKELSVYLKEELLEKYIDELEENVVLSNLWCKSQEENKILYSIVEGLETILKKEREIKRPSDSYNYGVDNTLDYIWYKLEELKKQKENDNGKR